MIITVLAVASLLIGTFLGTRFKVLVLVPAIVIGMAISVGVSLAQGGQLWWVIVLVAYLTGTALQIGYLAGSALACVFARRGRKDAGELVAAAQRLPKQA